MKSALLLLLSLSAYAQTARFPSAVAADKDLTVQTDKAQTTLTAPMNASQSSFTVVSGAKFKAGMIVTIENEQLLICSVVSNTINVGYGSCPNVDGRGYAGTTAASHGTLTNYSLLVSGNIVAYNHNAVVAEMEAVETALGANLANVLALIPNPLPVNKGGTNAQTASGARSSLGAAASGVNSDITSLTGLSTPLPTNEGGTGATTASGARTNLGAAASGANSDITSLNSLSTPLPANEGGTGAASLTGIVQGKGTSAMGAVAASSELQYLRRKPNAGSTVTYEFATLPTVNATDYNWPAQTPGGSLSVGNNTITLTPGPLGLKYNDPRVRIYISGGTGTAESVPLVTAGPGTCDGTGQTSCTITITAANTHSGAWTAQSSHAGIYEAIAANPFREIRIPAGTYTFRDCLTLPVNQSIALTGDGYDPAGTYGTQLNFASISSTSCTAAISLAASPGYPINPVTLKGMLIVGSGLTTPNWHGVSLTNVTKVTLDNVMISGFAGHDFYTSDSFEVYITNRSYFQYAGKYGASINGVANLVSIKDSGFGFNSRLNGNGNLQVVGTGGSPSTSVYLQGVAIEQAGQLPFTSVTTAFGAYFSNTSSLTLIGNYFEGNVGGSPNAQLVYGSGITSLTEIGNSISNAGTSALLGIDYASDTASVTSYGNTFYGANALRFFTASNLGTYVIGPDTCLASSTECTSHPRILGMGGSTGAGSAALGSNSPASTLTAPYTWLKSLAPDGQVVYIPAWK